MRYFIYFSFNGKLYHGWQKQKNSITIQEKIEESLSVLLMIDKGISQFIEIGPGKVLSGLIKRIDKNVKVSAINSEEDIKLININE